MPKPKPVWEQWKKDPKKTERLYYIYWAILFATYGLMAIGAVMFIILLLKR